MSNSIQRPIPEWHAQIAAELAREHAETSELSETARRRRARLGFMLIFAKETGKADHSIPHGQFGAWLERNVPAIPRRTAGDYITEANSICDLLRWQKGEIRHFETPPHRLLLAKPEALSADDKAHQKALFKIIDQQSSFRAVTRYQQVHLVDDATAEKIGRRKGEGGRPPAPTGDLNALIEHAGKTALRRMGKADQALHKLGYDFMAVDDNACHAFLSSCERTVGAMKRWLNTPAERREPKEIVALWKTL